LFEEYENAFVSVVVPVFNEAPNVVENLYTLLDELELSFKNFEIIVISDGSTDGTSWEVFRFKSEHIRVRIFPENMGKGAVVREGFGEAKGDYILFIDGGMEIHPREIRIFIGLMLLYRCDIVVGSKRHPQSRIHYPWFRRVLSWVFQKGVYLLFDVDVTDTQVGMKLFRREVIDAIKPHLAIDRYGFDLEILSLAKMQGHKRIIEAPISMQYFDKNRRFILFEVWHVAKVAWSLGKDTLRLYFRLKKLQSEGVLQPKEIPEVGWPR
jgi:dolichol-phosphate mannosyltransferase